MKKRIVIFNIIICALFLSTHLNAQTDSLIVNPGSGQAGSTGNIVTIYLANSVDIYGIQLTFLFNPEKFSISAVNKAGRANMMSIFTYNIANPGELILVMSDISGNSVNQGEGVIVEIVIDVTAESAPGENPLQLSNVILSDSNSQSVPVETKDGVFTITGLTVIFEVTVPAITPPADTIYIAGNFNSWDPGPDQNGTDGNDHDYPMINTGNNKHQISMLLEPGRYIEYKYTRGSWLTVEKNSEGEELSNRIFLMPETNSTRYDTVANWRDLSVTNIISKQVENPVTHFMLQNYPNPFNSVTNIKFTIPIPEHVNLKILNILGNEIVTLVDDDLPVGEYNVKWNAAGYSSGIYFYYLQSPNFKKSGKLLFIQ